MCALVHTSVMQTLALLKWANLLANHAGSNHRVNSTFQPRLGLQYMGKHPVYTVITKWLAQKVCHFKLYNVVTSLCNILGFVAVSQFLCLNCTLHGAIDHMNAVLERESLTKWLLVMVSHEIPHSNTQFMSVIVRCSGEMELLTNCAVGTITRESDLYNIWFAMAKRLVQSNCFQIRINAHLYIYIVLKRQSTLTMWPWKPQKWFWKKDLGMWWLYQIGYHHVQANAHRFVIK